MGRRRSGWILLAAAVGLASCGEVATVAGPDRSAQVEVCAAVVAEHLGVPAGEVAAVWDRQTPEGAAIVTAGVPGRMHTCEIDGQLRVRAVLHPEA